MQRKYDPVCRVSYKTDNLAFTTAIEHAFRLQAWSLLREVMRTRTRLSMQDLNDVIDACFEQYKMPAVSAYLEDAEIAAYHVSRITHINMRIALQTLPDWKYRAHLHNLEGTVRDNTSDTKAKYELHGWYQLHFLPHRIFNHFLHIQFLMNFEKDNADIKAIKNEILVNVEILRVLRCYELVKNISDPVLRERLTTALVENMIQHISELGNGEEYSVASGYDRHAVYVSFCRLKDNIIIRVDNLGAGSGKQIYSWEHSEEKGKVKPFVVAVIPVAEFGAKNANVAAYIQNIVSSRSDTKEIGLPKIYDVQNRLSGFKKDIRSMDFNAWPGRYQQRVGNCVVANHSVGMHIRLGNETYDRVWRWEDTHSNALMAILKCERPELTENNSEKIKAAFFQGIIEGNVELVQHYLEFQSNDTNLNTLTDNTNDRNPPLHLAAVYDHVELVRFLVAKGANLDRVDAHGRTAVVAAALEKRFQVVRCFLEEFNVPSTTIHNGSNLLHYTCCSRKSPSEREDPNLASYLINKWKLSVNETMTATLPGYRQGIASESVKQTTPLHLAVVNNMLKTAAVLIENGANIEAVDPNGATPLHYAARYGYLAMVQLFVNRKANLNAKTNHHYVIHEAVRGANTDIIVCLLKNGVPVDSVDNEGDTPLEWACERNDEVGKAFMRLLMAYKADIDHQNLLGNTTLHLAVQDKHARAIEFIVDAGANYKIKNHAGQTASLMTTDKAIVDTIERVRQVAKSRMRQALSSVAMLSMQLQQESAGRKAAALENIQLNDRVRRLELSIEALQQQIKTTGTSTRPTVQILVADNNQFVPATVTAEQLSQFSNLFEFTATKNVNTPKPSLYPSPYPLIDGLRFKSMPGDGSCLFHAVGRRVGRDYQYLRGMVTDHIRKNPEEFSFFIVLDEGATLEDYLTKMNANEYAGHVEIEVLMRILLRPIVVINPNGLISNLDDVDRYAGTPIFVQHNGRDDNSGHYDAYDIIDKDPKEILNDLVTKTREAREANESLKRP